ncbi:MAG: tRNA (adenosine(37)-N6)-threonylcarbamoyltransferase complex dimerization subunit type 1 TsaB [Dysgonomonas sp.]|nr:tRNA (adenosine(37)-N6)-threonylcarbamoyltransferase complex dimerization subunit type 1 TsaB [Dysgonomonas sp.]
MSCILNIETATSVCSVAVSDNGKIIFEKEETKGPSHATLLGVFVAEALTFLRKNQLKLDAVSVSCGPGSYTGLRIGVSEAKGLCYGLSIPLIAIETPLIMAERVLNSREVADDTLLCPMIDARRMEVYAALYDNHLSKVRDISADIVDEGTYKEYLDKYKILFFGDGSDKCKDVIKGENAVFLEDVYPSAKDMIRLSEEAFDKKAFVDVAYFEPFYLKDFIATTPKNKIL